MNKNNEKKPDSSKEISAQELLRMLKADIGIDDGNGKSKGKSMREQALDAGNDGADDGFFDDGLYDTDYAEEDASDMDGQYDDGSDADYSDTDDARDYEYAESDDSEYDRGTDEEYAYDSEEFDYNDRYDYETVNRDEYADGPESADAGDTVYEEPVNTGYVPKKYHFRRSTRARNKIDDTPAQPIINSEAVVPMLKSKTAEPEGADEVFLPYDGELGELDGALPENPLPEDDYFLPDDYDDWEEDLESTDGSDEYGESVNDAGGYDDDAEFSHNSNKRAASAVDDGEMPDGQDVGYGGADENAGYGEYEDDSEYAEPETSAENSGAEEDGAGKNDVRDDDDIRFLDIDELMRRYMSEQDYKRFGKPGGAKPATETETGADENIPNAGTPANNGTASADISELIAALNADNDGETVGDYPEGDIKDIAGNIAAVNGDDVSDDGESGGIDLDARIKDAEAYVKRLTGASDNDGAKADEYSPENPVFEEEPEYDDEELELADEDFSGEFEPEEKLPDEPEEDDSFEEAADSGDIHYTAYDRENGDTEAEDEIPEENGEAQSDGEVKEDPDFDETDVNLMLAFGMEEELAKTVGIDKVSELEAKADRESKQFENASETPRPAKKAYEYTSTAQTKSVFKSYKRKYTLLMYRIVICAVFAVVLFFYENIGVFGGKLPSNVNHLAYPVSNIMVSLQFTVFCALMTWTQFRDGIVSLIRLKPRPELFIPVMFVVNLIYDIGMCFASTGTDYKLYGFAFAFCALAALFGEMLTLRRDILNFNVIASKRPKYSLAKVDIDKAELEAEAFYDYLPDRPSIFKISKATFIDGFFRRSSGYSKNKRISAIMLCASVLVSIIMLIVGAISSKSGEGALTAGAQTFFFTAPVSVFIAYSMPFFRASKRTYESESAIIGDSALDEYTTASSVSFDDKDVFPSDGVKVKSVKVFGNNRIDYIIYNTASVFAIAGGPLDDVFRVATVDLGRSENAKLLTIASDGLEATVDGNHIYLGKANYIRKNGYVPVNDIDDEDIESGGELCIMYMVFNDEVAAKMYIQYRIDPDFEDILKRMYRSGICVGIKTFDPNINDDMLSQKIKLDKYPVRVLKCHDLSENSGTVERLDSGIVSKNSAKALLNTFTLCDRIKHVTRINLVIALFAAAVGLIISGFVTGFGGNMGVYSLYIFLYQLFWMVPGFILSRMFI